LTSEVLSSLLFEPLDYLAKVTLRDSTPSPVTFETFVIFLLSGRRSHRWIALDRLTSH
jgi:hypothetical protein